MWRASAAALASARRWRHKLPDLVMVAGDRVERRERGTDEKARFFRLFGTLRPRERSRAVSVTGHHGVAPVKKRRHHPRPRTHNAT